MKMLTRFMHSQRGSAMPFIALGILMLAGATGGAIDMGRVQVVKARMQNALDSAGLAIGTNLSTTVNFNTETAKYFYANFPANYMGTTITTLSATPSADGGVITLKAEGKVNTTFMKLFGISSVNV